MSDLNVPISDVVLDRLEVIREISLHPSMHTRAPSIVDHFKELDEATVDVRPDLAELLGETLRARGRATRRRDGRRTPVVIGAVRDTAGRSRAGVRVVLEDRGGTRLDSMRTTRSGAFALTMPRPEDESAAASAVLRIVVPGIADELRPVSIPDGSQHALLDLSVADLGIDRLRRAALRAALVRARLERLTSGDATAPSTNGSRALSNPIPDDPTGEATGTVEDAADDLTDTVTDPPTDPETDVLDDVTDATDGTTGPVTDPVTDVLPDTDTDTGGTPTPTVDELLADLIAGDGSIDEALLDELLDGALGSDLLEDAILDVDELRGDDPFDVLPTDIDPDLCHDAGRLFSRDVDTILTNPGRADDFRARRTRILKRLSIPRLGPAEATGAAPRRYIVSMRQDWRFLGYTLGEITDLEPLDPGRILDTVTRTVSSTTERASEATRQVQRTVQTLLESSLSRMATVDSLVDLTTQVDAGAHTDVTTSTSAGVGPKDKTGAIIGGIIGGIIAGPLGGLIGAGIGGGGAAADLTNTVDTNVRSSLRSSATTETDIDTSLQLNEQVRNAQSVLNNAISQVSSAVHSIRESLDSTVSQVSPLLGRVTNLLRWRMYENHLVCSMVEDVLELREYEIFTNPKKAGQPVFTDEDIVDYRRIFEPSLLEPSLRPHFDLLAAGGPGPARTPVARIRATIHYTTNGISGGRLTIAANPGATPATATVELRPGGTVAVANLSLSPAAALETIGSATITLRCEPGTVTQTLPTPFPGMSGFEFQVPDTNARVTVTRVELSFDPGPERRQTEDLGTQLSATASSPVATHGIVLRPPVDTWRPEDDPLFRHVNRNATHYLSRLLQAALSEPSLRDDAPQLAEAIIVGADGSSSPLGSDSALWRLPIMGFEGNRVLVGMPVADDDEFGQSLLDDPGAGTLVQLATPGVYSEALEGLLGLTDALGMLHPAVLPLPTPAMPPLALVDLAGHAIPTTPPVP